MNPIWITAYFRARRAAKKMAKSPKPTKAVKHPASVPPPAQISYFKDRYPHRILPKPDTKSEDNP